MTKKITYSLLENVISCHVTLYRVFLKRYAGLDTLLPYELLVLSRVHKGGEYLTLHACRVRYSPPL